MDITLNIGEFTVLVVTLLFVGGVLGAYAILTRHLYLEMISEDEAKEFINGKKSNKD